MKIPTKKMRRFHASLPQEQLAQLDIIADDTGRGRSEILAMLVEAAYKAHEEDKEPTRTTRRKPVETQP